MTAETKCDIGRIAAHFQIDGRFLDAAPYGNGHIHDTFASRFDGDNGVRRYIHQRINHNIFTDPPRLMENIARICDHMQAKLEATTGADPEREAMKIVKTKADALLFIEDDGTYWRTYLFIEGAQSYDVIEHNNQALEAARAFSRFQRLLDDLPGDPLIDTIPGFHHTPIRFAALEGAIEADSCNRATGCAAEIDFALGRKPIVSRVTEGLEKGSLPIRVTHNDTKVNNVLLDDETGVGIAVIDLDTVMNGSSLYDFGDLVRTSTGHFDESEKDLGKVYIDVERFASVARGYLGEALTFLTPAEMDLLVFSGQLITFENGIRFLTDHLEGDVYYKIHNPDQNLDRTRTQFAMVRSIEANAVELDRIIEGYR